MKEAIRKSYEARKGTVESLCKDITRDDFEGLCLMGLIKMGVERIDGRPTPTWSATDALREEYEFFFGHVGSEEVGIAREFYPYA